ncbi:MAG TPA: DegQ family serine endoprotease [Terriglobia bacterium]|nr:DegQ family serine endoprotease [Terriglobia bacterium]
MRIDKRFLRENLGGLSLTLIGVLTLGLSLMLYQGNHLFPDFALAQGKALDGPDIDILERQNQAYERIAKAVTPAIVAIQSTQVIKVQQSPFMNEPFFRQFFGNMFPQVPREQREHALGSGVIVSPDGYIVTNNHVVAKATEISVTLSDKRTYKGKVVGADPQTDVAVIKIDGHALPTAPFADSDQLKVGDTVMAFGNPFGQFFTVTRGSVSALGRSGGEIEVFQNFIQTDAAINPGNSGGALVNVHGQVVGINTAILSGNSGPGGEGGSVGIGFAIPSNMAKHVMEDLVKTGKVSRGYLGVSITNLREDMAKQFKVPDTAGALANDVTPGGPADKAGLKNGDVIRKLNGQVIEDPGQLTAQVTNLSPGAVATLDILRDGQPMTIKVTLGERPSDLSARIGGGGGVQKGTLRGIDVENLTPSIRDQLGLPSNVTGVVISQVDPNSPAGQYGLQEGDVIESINRQPVHSVADFNKWAAQAKGQTLLRINRQGNGYFVVISPDEGGSDGQ